MSLTPSGTETPPITLLHGVNNTAEDWDVLCGYLSPRDCTAPDLPALANVDEIARSVEPALGTTGVVLGHSFGGYVALALLAAVPERISGLVLVNSHDGADGAEGRARREVSVNRARAGEYLELGQAATAMSYYGDHLDDPQMMAQRERALANYGAEKFIAHQLASAARPDRREILVSATVPVLVVAATEDRVIPADRQREMAESVGADFVTIDRAGHMLPAEQPKLLAEAVDAWLTRLELS